MRPRILVLTPRFPYPTLGGDRLRIMHICRALSQDNDLTLLSLCESKTETMYLPQDGIFTQIERVLLPRWRSFLNTAAAVPTSTPLQLAYYRSSEFAQKVGELAPRHDVLLAHLIRTGQYLESATQPKILEMTDAISLNYAGMVHLTGSRSPKRIVYAVEQKRLRNHELKVVGQFDRVWLTSQRDVAYLDAKANRAIDVIGNGVDLDALRFREPAADADAIVFIGNMVSLQNQDACLYFIREILPLVRRRIDARFRIVGNTPRKIAQRLGAFEGVDVVGRVKHIADGTRNGFCGVCPVRAGAGIQNKVLEYMALGLPCVSSEVGVGGVVATPNEELLIYSSPEQAAEQIVQLYRDHALRKRIASNARRRVESTYAWPELYGRFNESVRAVLSIHASRSRSLQEPQ